MEGKRERRRREWVKSHGRKKGGGDKGVIPGGSEYRDDI